MTPNRPGPSGPPYRRCRRPVDPRPDRCPSRTPPTPTGNLPSDWARTPRAAPGSATARRAPAYRAPLSCFQQQGRARRHRRRPTPTSEQLPPPLPRTCPALAQGHSNPNDHPNRGLSGWGTHDLPPPVQQSEYSGGQNTSCSTRKTEQFYAKRWGQSREAVVRK